MTILLFVLIFLQNMVTRYEIEELREEILSLRNNTYNDGKDTTLKAMSEFIKSMESKE